MMFAVCNWAFSLALSSMLAVSCVAISGVGLKLVEPRPGSENVCFKSELSFSCTTTGRGDTELRFGRISVRFRHSRYTPGTPNQDENQTLLDNEVRAGNLLRSDSMECIDKLRNVTDYCYTMSLVVLITNRTMCSVIKCRTVFNDGMRDVYKEFGNATIARTLPQPVNLNVSTPSRENLTFTWEAGTTVTCSTITYEVTTTSKCGDCPLNRTTNNNYITCKDLTAGQWCNVSVRSMVECGVYSNFTTLPVQVPEATPAVKNKDGAALGIGLGVSLPIILLIVGAIVGIAILLCIKRPSKSSYGVERVPESTPTPDHHTATSDSKKNEEEAEIHLNNDTKEVSVDQQLQPLLDTENSLNDTKVDSEDPMGDTSVDRQQLLPPFDPHQSVTLEEADEKQASLVNGAAAVTGSSDQPLSTSSKEYEGRFDGQKVGGANAVALPPPVQSTDESAVKEKPAALVGVKTIGMSSQDEDTSTATFRDITVMPMLPLTVQTFNASAENKKQSTSSTVPPSLVTEGDNMEAYNNPKPPQKDSKWSESGKPLSQDSELTLKDGEEEIATKKPVALSDNEDGPSQAVAIDGKGAPTFANVAGSCPADVPDILKRHEERLNKLETYQFESKSKIEELNAQISELSIQLETMRTRYAALERKSEAERQRHQEEEERLQKLIKQLQIQLVAERARVQQLEKENKMIPRNALSTDTNTLETRPDFQRTKSCPAPS